MEERPTRRPRSMVILWLLALYVLSVGPVVGALERAHVGSNAVEWLQILYAPLIWLYDHSDILARLLERYVDLFTP